jgi:o-succinylbenzoate synthase
VRRIEADTCSPTPGRYKVRLDAIELREIALDLVAPFETSFGTTSARRIILVRVRAGDATGWGECTVPEDPYFNEEFTESAWEVLRRFVIPPIIGSEYRDAEHTCARLARIRGHRMAIGGVEAALWDLDARTAGRPLFELLGGVRRQVPCGVSIGLQTTVDGLIRKVATELEAGYRRIKIKIAPGRDVELVRAVREHFGDIVLSVDANSAYTLGDLHVLQELDQFGLLMIEQPLRPGDLLDHATLQSRLHTAVCLDESIVDEHTARQALEIGACRIVNIKLGRVGGHAEARRIAHRCEGAGVPVWCGGMLEAGIGRLHNAAMSTLAPFTLPGDVSDSRRYYTRDIVIPRPTVSGDGLLSLSDDPGFGAEVDEAYVADITRRAEAFTAE